MKYFNLTIAAAFLSVSTLFGQVEKLSRELAKPVLVGGGHSTWDAIYTKLEKLDAAADETWKGLKSRAQYDTYRRQMHSRFIDAMGGFPARTPLNAKVVSVVRKERYRIEKILFESMPGIFVTANFFVPEGGAVPRPAVALSCGHAHEGKDSPTYLRACVLLAERGIAALMIDPYEQGERRQYENYTLCHNHNLIGAKAMLLGWSMAMLRTWDAIRAVDYLESRKDVDASRIGFMGQSGGGTMAALMTAADWRLKATAPSCYLTSLTSLCSAIGPQDAEQNVFGQLAFGLNHTGYALIPDTKVAITGRFGDMFPWSGTARLYRTVQSVASMLGKEDGYTLNFAPGPHGWTESTMTASADWMAAQLLGRKGILPLDMAKYRVLDVGIRYEDVDTGLAKDERGVTKENSTLKLPGARDIHAVLKERFDGALASRKPRSDAELAAIVKRTAGVIMPSESGIVVKEVCSAKLPGVKLLRLAFLRPDSLVLPAVLLEPAKAVDGANPVLMAGRDRPEFAAAAAEILKAGKSALVIDISGCGEIGQARHKYYSAEDTPEEGAALMLYMLGESFAGHRATDLLAAASWLGKRKNSKVELYVKGPAVIGGAHAYQAGKRFFSSVKVEDAPAGWAEVVNKEGMPVDYRFTHCVNGALLEYDWKDLLPASAY